ASELFNLNQGVRFEHIPFKSTTESLTALLNGQVSMQFADPGPLMPFAVAGKVRVLATTGERRWPALPEVPTMTEAGVEAVGSGWFMGVVAPRAMPTAIVDRLQNEINAILRLPDIEERFKSLGVIGVGGTSAEFEALIAREIPRW